MLPSSPKALPKEMLPLKPTPSNKNIGEEVQSLLGKIAGLWHSFGGFNSGLPVKTLPHSLSAHWELQQHCLFLLTKQKPA